MTAGKRRVYGTPFKAKVALAAAKRGSDVGPIGKPVRHSHKLGDGLEEAVHGSGGRAVHRWATAAGGPGHGRAGTLRTDRPSHDGGRVVENKSAEVG